MIRRAARVDANQWQIADALRALHMPVTLLHAVGGGVPDLLVGTLDKRFIVIEVKDGEKPPSAQKLTQAQEKWHAAHAGFPVFKVASIDEALEAVGYVVSK